MFGCLLELIFGVHGHNGEYNDEYLAITGLGIENMKVAKKARIWPFQKIKKFDVLDRVCNIKFELQFKSGGKILMSVWVAVGAVTEDKHALIRYAKFIMYSSYVQLYINPKKASIDQVTIDRIILNFAKKVIVSEVRRVAASVIDMFELCKLIETRAAFPNIKGLLLQNGLAVKEISHEVYHPCPLGTPLEALLKYGFPTEATVFERKRYVPIHYFRYNWWYSQRFLS